MNQTRNFLRQHAFVLASLTFVLMFAILGRVAYLWAIADLPWAVVSRLDLRQAYAVINDLTLATLGLGAVMLAGLCLSFRLWWRSEQAREVMEHRALARHYDYLSKFAYDGIVLADAGRRIVEANDRMTELYGYSREQLLGMHFDELRAEEERPKLAGDWQTLMDAGALMVETLHQRRDGSTFPVECSLRLIEHEGARFIQAIVRDISERRLAQQRIERLSRLYQLLYRANESIVRTRQADHLFPEICRLIQRDGGFELVWVGLKEPGADMIKPVAHAAAPGYSVAQVLEAKARAAQGPAVAALCQGRPYVCNDTANDFSTREWHQRSGCEAAGAWAAFPLECRESLCGVVSVCARDAGAFDYETANVLAELAASLSAALDRFSLEKQREATLAELRDNEQRLRLSAQVIEQSNEGILITDRENRVVSVNPAFTRATGYAAEEVLGQNPGILKSGRHNQAFYQALWDSIRVNGGWHGEIWNRRKDGHIYPEWLSISTIRGADGAIQNHIAIFTDITELKRSEERIRYLAYYDALTRLPNRAFFQERLASALAQAERHSQPMAVCVLDLDHFKQINDSLGHLVGDSLLQEAARRMSGSVREQDTVARPGGDEFMLILPDTDAEGAAHMAEKLVRRLAEPVCIDGYELHISCSLGLSLYPANGRDAASLIQSADAAMYRAKQHGRNNYQFFTEAMHAEAVRVLTLEQHLRQAPGRGELFLHYQPQVDLQSGQPIGCEALLRWRHPEWGMVATDNFIAVAEDSGLIVEIGLWVLREAASQIKAWDAAGHAPLPVSVNLSAAQFHRDHREGPLVLLCQIRCNGMPGGLMP
jgi:diguanylate cyclase (GGDEF)-like protein/PAS domain S-box-containing protein